MVTHTKQLADAAVVAPSRTPAWLYSATILLSAFLLFQIQPILAKLILPWFGGAAAVWLVSLAFFQLTYLFGNLYAHASIHLGGLRLAGRVHALFLLASLLLLPIAPRAFWQPQGNVEPVWRILQLLTATVGVPFLLLSATSPLLQTSYAIGRDRPQPYRLYALSNLGSLVALLSYPVLIEPAISTHHQVVIWSVAYAVFVASCSLIAWRAPLATAPPPEQARLMRPGRTVLWLWLSLAACASSLLVCVTNHISQNVAAIPLLWVVPLSLYLLTLILCFEGRSWYRRPVFLPLLPVAVAAMIWLLSPRFESAAPGVGIPVYFLGFFVCCMVCHGEMAALKPTPELLTLFYLTVSAGGAVGGLFSALLAPRIFRGFYEFPLTLAACVISVVLALRRNAESPGRKLAFPAWASVAVAAVLLFLILHTIWTESRQTLMVRNFYGVLRVNVLAGGAVRPAVTQLRNGTVVHGEEILEPSRSNIPTTYYGEQSGIGIALLFARQSGKIRVGAIGLGIGTVARYGQPGDQYVFYEINPQDIDLAKNLFDFMRHSEASVEVIPGDARLSLQEEPNQDFDVLILDAFSGDAIPVHLLTREAFELYFRHLKPHGLVAIHVSNLSLNLPPLVEAVAAAAGASGVKVTNSNDDRNAVYESTWMLLDRNASPNSTVRNLVADRISLPAGTTAEIQQQDGARPWTDDYSNVAGILKW